MIDEKELKPKRVEAIAIQPIKNVEIVKKPRAKRGNEETAALAPFICPEGAISLEDGKPKINYELCNGCMICIRECPGSIEEVEE